MKLIEKIQKELKNKNLIWKISDTIFYKMQKYNKIFVTSNKNLQTVASQYKCYKLMKRKYNNYIKNYKFYSENVEKQVDKIWICWLQGIEKAPNIIKACINSVKESNPSKEVIIITYNNLSDYIDLPKHILDYHIKKRISNTAFSDIIRVSLLAKHGGIWIDATVLCTGSKFIDLIDELPLFVFKQLNLTNSDRQPIVASSWFMSALPGNHIITLTRDLMFKYWEDYKHLKNYFILHILFTLATEKYHEEWDEIPTYNNNSPHIIMFELERKWNEKRWEEMLSMSDIHKLQRHKNYSDLTDSNYQYIINRYMNRN